mmetsp:Transcript_11227/g.13554  ORF Transcript_11227/g.13554 Transcript_11227/m.13554 type:complete len:425 (+) Transcript_11227:113-1387(+)|eukprot:CAMPEP_0195296876 /NCGR_PEP_ID=MMETSP0707-20130614/20326_1 /TAXON_ID=33640 /ORGANISM="Asterionellopsis glacialis, Strain CCMP134" /LENGTH=424 /DNA_ID=CAMNT_0040358503 /DNA_START=42 /DNA_END=1316 /DNA_ORIENTATION=+
MTSPRSVAVAVIALLNTPSALAWTTPSILPKKQQRFSKTVLYEIKAERPKVELQDLTGGRPGSIIETEEELERKEEIFAELESGERSYEDAQAKIDDYGDPDEDIDGALFDIDDPNALDSSTLGVYNIFDLKSKFDYEWTPESGDPDPNLLDPSLDYVKEPEKTEDGIEFGWDPIFGSSNPIDTRTVTTPVDSYMIDDKTRDDSLLEPLFPPNDPEISFNEDIVKFRKSMKVIDTFIDPFVGEELPAPRHVAKWHGYPEQMAFPEKNYTNNRFTAPEDLTDFDAMTPHRARVRAVELARAKNAEWLPEGVSEKWHQDQRQPYENHGTLVGTLKKADYIDEEKVAEIQPALDVLKSSVELLSIENDGTVFRFAYHGLMKNKFGMAAWTETLIRDLGVECTGVVFETGFRKRDPIHDGGFGWYGPY